MSYEKAKQCFQDNIARLETGSTDPLIWNISVGLLNLTVSIQKEMDELRQIIRQTEKAQERKK